MKKNNNHISTSEKQSSTKKVSKTNQKQTKLQKLVQKNPHFQFLSNGKIRCILTSHEFLPTIQNYQQYLSSKSYKKGVQSQFDISEYQDYLVPHKQNKHFLYCRLTGTKLPKKKTAIEKHVNSKKFKTRLQQIQQDQDEISEDQEQIELLDQEEQAVDG